MDDVSLARAGGTGAPVRAATANVNLMHDPCTMSRIPPTDKTANKEPWVPMTSATEVGTKHSHPVRPSQAGLTEGGSGRALSHALERALRSVGASTPADAKGILFLKFRILRCNRPT